MRKITLCLIYEWFNEDFASKRQHQHYVCSTYSDKVWCFSFLLHSHRLLHASRLFHQDSQSSKCAAFFASFTELDCRVLAIQFIVPMYFNEIFIHFLMCIISEDQKDELTTIKFIKFSLGCNIFFHSDFLGCFTISSGRKNNQVGSAAIWSNKRRFLCLHAHKFRKWLQSKIKKLHFNDK